MTIRRGSSIIAGALGELPSQSGQSGKFLTTNGSVTSWSDIQSGSSRNIGEIVTSTVPLTDAGLHLLDGSLISGSGSYADFVTYIAGLVSTYPDLFEKDGWYNQSNIVPTDISENNLQGFTVSATLGETDMYLALNPSLNPSYPRWQFNAVASSSPQSLTIMFPNTRSIDYYTVTQWCDSNLTGRIVTSWTLEYTTDSGTTWTQCDLRSDIPQTNGYEGTYLLNNPVYDVNGIRFTATGGGSSGYSSVGQIRFYGKEFLSAEQIWQDFVTEHGVCGKFVYDGENNTVRLPKYSNKIWTSDISSNGTVTYNMNTTNYQYTRLPDNSNNPSLPGSGKTMYTNNYCLEAQNLGHINIDPNGTLITDLSGISSPLNGYWYIVIATSTKTQIEVDIDQIATDLNGKADVDLTNTVPTSNFATALNTAEIRTVVETYVNGTEWYRVWSDGWIEQGGYVASASSTVNFLKVFKNAQYSLTFGTNASSYNYTAGTSVRTSASFTVSSWGFPASWYACGY